MARIIPLASLAILVGLTSTARGAVTVGASAVVDVYYESGDHAL